MSQNLLICMQRGQARILEKEVEAWKADQIDAVLARKVEEVVRISLTCLRVCGMYGIPSSMVLLPTGLKTCRRQVEPCRNSSMNC